MRRCADFWCPIMNDRCREDCVWLDPQYSIDEDGISRTEHCIVENISAALLEMSNPGKHQYT